MKIFISWSGKLSQEVALVLDKWLPRVLPYVEPFVSSEDIKKGERWAEVLAQELSKSDFGIICVTEKNLDSKWLNFESGALSKSVKKGRVCPFLINIEEVSEKGPLSQFQRVKLKKSDVESLFFDISEASGRDKPDRLAISNSLNDFWPNLEGEIMNLLRRCCDEGNKVFECDLDRGRLTNPSDGSRNIAFKVETINSIFNHIQNELRNDLPDEKIEDIFFKAGYNAGLAFGDKIEEKWDGTFGKEPLMDKVERWCQFDSEVGFGSFKNKLEIDESTQEISGTIDLNENFQTDRGSSKDCIDCSLMVGYVAGVLEKLCHEDNIKVDCDKDHCPLIIKDHDICTFKISTVGAN